MRSRRIAAQVERQVKGLGDGAVFTPKDFLDLGSRAAIDQTLSRLSRRGVIRRLARGLYYVPRRDPVFGLRAPVADAVAGALARKTGSVIQVTGAQAANQLGWSEHVPAQSVYLTNGARRSVRIGRRVIALRPASPKNLIAPGTKVGSVVQAFRFMGPDASESLIGAARAVLSRRERQVLAREAARAADWLRPMLRRVAEP
jgi:hypothetical protein